MDALHHWRVVPQRLGVREKSAGSARRIAGRLGKITYPNTAGLRIAFGAQQDIQAMTQVPRTTTAGRS